MFSNLGMFTQVSLSAIATTYILSSRHVFPKHRVTNMVHLSIWSLTRSRNLITRKLKTVIKANYCNYHFWHILPDAPIKTKYWGRGYFPGTLRLILLKISRSFVAILKLSSLHTILTFQDPLLVSYNIVKSCAKMYSTTVFSNLPRTIDHREGRTGNIIILFKTSSSI